MSDIYANDFTQIPNTLAQNDTVRYAVLYLVANEPMPGKVTEGGDRLAKFRAILTDFVNGQISISEAIRRTQMELPRHTSPHSGNNRVFAADWEERLVRTQLSRFYNQAVMEKLLADGATECFVPHSSAEKSESPCSVQLAGRKHKLSDLYQRLIDSYRNGNWSQVVKIPDHPHCTHVVMPAKIG